MSTTTRAEGVWWAPHRLSWWTSVLFAIGATCFFVGPIPGFVEALGSAVDGAVFFVGSIFFTTAATLQFLQGGTRIDRWSSGVQLVGTVFFNVTTFRAMQTGLENPSYDKLVWRPDAYGSICFLVSGYLAYVSVCRRFACFRWHRLDWKIAAVNLVGCIFFGISAVAGYVTPSTGSALDLAAANLFTALGGLCFLIGAVLLLPEGARAARRRVRSTPPGSGRWPRSRPA